MICTPMAVDHLAILKAQRDPDPDRFGRGAAVGVEKRMVHILGLSALVL